MPDRYLERNTATGGVAERVGRDASAGVADAGKIPALNTAGKLDASMLPDGVGADTKSVVAGEALVAGDLVYVYDDAGTPKMRKASGASGGNAAVGYVDAAVANNAAGNIFFSGENTFASGLTTGARVYLSDAVAGTVTSTAVTGANKIHQFVGTALSATEFRFNPEDPIVLAA